MTKQNIQQGFSTFIIVIIIAVVAIVGLVGFNVYNRQQDNKSMGIDEIIHTQTMNQQSDSSSDVKTAPSINNVSDLNNAEKILDQTDPSDSNNSDSSQLDNQTSIF
jgi:predicted negative regulator of RcsB-dependent stress response